MAKPVSDMVRAAMSIIGEHRLDENQLWALIEQSLAATARSVTGLADVACRIDPASQDLHFFQQQGAAEVALKLTTADLGRNGVKFFQQDMQRRLHQLEEAQRFATWTNQVGEIVSGKVVDMARGQVVVEIGDNLQGTTRAVLAPQERIPNERYMQGTLLDFLIVGFTETFPRTVLLSRSSPEFVTKLIEREVHELRNGDIEVRVLAREPGIRTKVVVAAVRPDLKVDPAAACIGSGGNRVNRIRDRLAEPIDIIPWSDEPQKLIIASIGLKDKAGVVKVEIDEAAKTAVVYVDEANKAKAIGNRGVNVHLASQACGYEITVRDGVDADTAPQVSS